MRKTVCIMAALVAAALAAQAQVSLRSISATGARVTDQYLADGEGHELLIRRGQTGEERFYSDNGTTIRWRAEDAGPDGVRVATLVDYASVTELLPEDAHLRFPVTAEAVGVSLDPESVGINVRTNIWTGARDATEPLGVADGVLRGWTTHAAYVRGIGLSGGGTGACESDPTYPICGLTKPAACGSEEKCGPCIKHGMETWGTCKALWVHDGNVQDLYQVPNAINFCLRQLVDRPCWTEGECADAMVPCMSTCSTAEAVQYGTSPTSGPSYQWSLTTCDPG